MRQARIDHGGVQRTSASVKVHSPGLSKGRRDTCSESTPIVTFVAFRWALPELQPGKDSGATIDGRQHRPRAVYGSQPAI